MALLFMDGFDAGDFATKWDVTSGSSSTTNLRFGSGRNWSNGASATSVSKNITASSQVTVGFAIYTTNNSVCNYVSLLGDSGATTHITVTRGTSSGVLEIRRGSFGGTLLASGATFLLINTWHYVEVQATISDTVGVVTVRLNGSTTAEVSFSGDTKNAGTNTTIDRCTFGATSGGASNYMDDVYVLNSTGSANTTFLGDVRITTLTPTGNGNSSQLTGSDSDSVNNYQLVDELPTSSADYVGSATAGQKDTYLMADMPSNITTAFAVQNNIVAAKSDAYLASTRSVLRSGGTDYAGTTHVLNTSYQTYYDLYETNPATAVAWTISDVNGLEAGMEVI